MNQRFLPRPFEPTRSIPGGDLQTIFARRVIQPNQLAYFSSKNTLSSLVPIIESTIKPAGEWDHIAVHRNDPIAGGADLISGGADLIAGGADLISGSADPISGGADPISSNADRDSNGTTRGNVLLVHGITGCHAAPYMTSTAMELCRRGFRTFRMDARGCGDAKAHTFGITHAGRSEDVARAIEFIHQSTNQAIHVIGFSLGGNQILRLAGRVANDSDASPGGWENVVSFAAVAPPIHLERCAANMDRWIKRIYNWHFIRGLIRSIPDRVRQRPEFLKGLDRGPIRTLREFDHRLTAPLGGFESGDHYYEVSAALPTLSDIDRQTLVIADDRDPIVPSDCFFGIESNPRIHRLNTSGGGHVGYRSRIGQKDWLVETLADWVEANTEGSRSLKSEVEVEV